MSDYDSDEDYNRGWYNFSNYTRRSESPTYPAPKRIKTYFYKPLNPVIPTTVSSLKDIAFATVAISLWNHVNVLNALIQANHDCAKDSYCWDPLKTQVAELCSQLPIPHSLTTQIRQYISKVLDEITNWATYHFRSVFLNAAQDYIVYNLLSDLIWHSDATINCKETAKNISKSRCPRLSDVEKYYFLCTYCLEDEMQQMSPVLLNIFQDYVDFDQYPLIRYWNCYFSKNLHLILLEENLSLDCSMFRHRYVDNWPAKEYFFDRLSPDDQVTNAIWLIDELGVMYQKALLMKLNESQRISVYLERSVQLITNYVKTGVNSTDIIKTWYEIRDLITLEQFTSLFAELLKGKADGSVLTKVWISIDFDLQNHLLNYNGYEFIKKILYSFEWTKDYDFIIMVLQDLNADMKTHVSKQFITDFCEKFFFHRESLQWLDRFTEVYYGEDSKQFRQYLVLNLKSIKNLCFNHYSSGDVDGFNDMLTHLFSQMPNRIAEYKINLLKSGSGILKCVELFDSDIVALNKIFLDTLPTIDSVIVFRKMLVVSDLGIQKLKDMLVKNDLDKVKKVVESFLISDQDRENFKKLLMKDPSHLIRNVFRKSDKESYLNSVLVWVSGNENLVNEYKKTIPIDGIFNAMLKEIIPERRGSGYYRWHKNKADDLNSASFDSLNRFLIWYFESHSEVKKYKIRRIYSFSDIEAITSLAKKQKHEEMVRLKTVMKWFFDDDKDEIEKFYKENGKSKVGSILYSFH